MPTRRSQTPPIVSGYPLGNVQLTCYRPAAAVNIVDNPSIERGTTNYTAVGGSIARSATRQRWGAYSLAVTPTSGANDGVYYGSATPLALGAGNVYYASVFGYFAAGVPYKIYFASTGGAQVGAAKAFVGRGKWERVIAPYLETASADRRVYITKNNHASTTVFYIDGLNVSTTLSSYVDGDQSGLVDGQTAYYWTGTPHASASVRVLATRAGGVEMKFSDFGFLVLGLVGFGLNGFESLSTPNAYIGGARFERTVYTERTFDVIGIFQGGVDGFPNLQTQRQALENVLRPNAGIISQPMVLTYQTVDDDGEAMGEPVDIVCSLQPGGFSGNWNNDYQEAVTLTFRNYLPFLGVMQGEAGASLNYQTEMDAGNIFSRDSNGVWSMLGTGLSGANYPLTAIELPNGKLLVGGNFLNADADPDADFLAIYDYASDTFEALNATPLNGAVLALGLLPDDNTVIVGGAATNAGGAADADYLFYLNLTTGAFSAINATPLGAQVDHILVLPNGNAVISGNMTNAGGSADADYAFYLVGTTYTAINATPLSARVFLAVKLNNGNVVLIGNFANAGGDANADNKALLTVSTGVFSSLNDDPMAGDAVGEIGLDGRLYVGGTNGLYSWQGPAAPWVLLGGGLNGAMSKVLTLPDGTLLIGGTDLEMVAAPGLVLNGLGGWNGSTYVFTDLIVPTGGTVYHILRTRDNKLVVLGDFSAVTLTAIGITTLTNDGTAETYPVFEFTGPGTLYQVRNYTTGDVVYFNLTLNAGERAVLTLGPGNVSFFSTFRGNIYNTILPGSFTATFRLVPGANSIGVLMAGTTDVNTAASAHWRVPYLSADDAIYK